MKITKLPPFVGAILRLLPLATAILPSSLFALGIRLPDQDALATARGNAFVATASDPAAVYYNPAGISQLDGANFSLGMYGITLASRYTGPAGSLNSQRQWAALPQTFSTLSFTNYHLTFGFGVYSPYGLSMAWPYSAPWVKAGLPRSGEIDYVRASPVLAWQPCDTLSIAVGAMLDYSDAELQANGLSLHGRDTDAGFNAGILWHPLEQHSFGLTYRSATDMNYQGHVTFIGAPVPAQSAALNFHLPQTLVFGYSFRPTSNWNLEADADWTDWTSLRSAAIQTGPIPAGPALQFNWKPSMIYEFGVTRNFGEGWRASAGYMYSENSTPDSSFNALIPDGDRHLFSIGIGKTYTRLRWDVAYQMGFGPSRSVSGDGIPLYNGSYEFFSHAISFNLGWRF